MSFQRIHQSRSQNPQTSSSTSQFAPRPFSVQEPKRTPTQEELENQTFQQNKFEATGLQLKEKYGTITPVEQERLGVLQAKVDDFWAQRLERASRFGHNFANVSVHAPGEQVSAPIQPQFATRLSGASVSPLIQAKLTIGQVNDRHEQEADRIAEQVMSMSPPATPNIQRQAEKSKDNDLIQVNDGAIAVITITPLIQRQPIPAAQQSSAASAITQSLPSADELTTRIARCIGIWETNRGQDNPAPKESILDTVAGVHASMATIEQVTMPTAITALKKYKFLRDKATPPLTKAELESAEARCKAVATLLESITQVSANHWAFQRGVSPVKTLSESILESITQVSGKGEMPNGFIKGFIKNNTNAITATGLNDDDVKTMFSAVELRTTLDTALTNANAAGEAAKEAAQKEKKTAKQQAAAGKVAKQKSVQDSIDAIPAAERLGLGTGSLRPYINKPIIWGENRAGWQRKAISLMPNNVGSRIESVAVSDGGTALVIPMVGSRVNSELAKTPVPSLENIVKTVAQKNNSREANYGTHVWETYHRLYPADVSGK